MSVLPLINQQACLGGYKITNALNQLAIDVGADAVDVTTFGSAGAREFTGGLKTLGFSMAGYYNAVTGLDAALQTNLRVSDTPITFCSQAGTAGEVAYIFKALQATYTRGGNIGDAFTFSLSGNNSSSSGAVRGTLMLNSTTVTATANGTARQLGAVIAGKKIYGALHVFAVAGTSSPTLTVRVESDDNSGFTSATTRLTFTSKTAVGSDWQELAGAITDDWWRVVVTVSGTNPVFGAMVSLGIK